MKKAFFFSLLLSLILLSSSAVFAKTPVYEPTRKNPSEVQKIDQEKRIEVRENAKERLDEKRLKLCLVKEKVIQNRTSALNKLSENIIDKFDAVSGRVQKYYTEKVLPTGKTIENYDALLTDIEEKKVAAKLALENAKANVAEFKCDGDDPKGQLSGFREEMQALKLALQDYRTSIKNLITAVKSVTGDSNEE